MSALPQLVAEALPVVALLALLVAAFRNPRARAEAAVAIVATALALAPAVWGRPQLSAHQTERTLADLAPVVVYLVTILLVARVCEVAGLFAATARLLHPRGSRPAARLLTTAFLLAAVVTAVLSLDATVVLLTPVVLAAARAVGTSSRPTSYACLRMANSSSLLLPVSNLTNLLALPAVHYSFIGFAAATAPVLVIVLIVEYVVLRLLFRAELRATPEPARAPGAGARTTVDHTAADRTAVDRTAADRTAGAAVGRGVERAAGDRRPTEEVLPVFPAAVVAAMLVGFALTSPFGVAPAWVSGIAASILVAWGRRMLAWRAAIAAAHVPFALFVLALGVVVAAIAGGPIGDLVTHLVPGSTGFAGLLGVAVLATVAANLLTNLSATLLVVPLVAPLGDLAVLAALIGLNVGSGLTPAGSLANLLWSRTLADHDARPTTAAFLRVSLVATPLTVLAAVTTVWLVG